MRLVSVLAAALLLCAACASAVAPRTDEGVLSTGRAEPHIVAALSAPCRPGVRASPAVTGTVTAADGSRWSVPADFADGPAALDVYNECSGGETRDYAARVPTVEIDPDGAEITGYLFADNYFELYVNGRLVARDGTGFTPFNSAVVRFRARHPLTYAVKLVDGETHPGIGLEYDEHRTGDGGFIARFSDGTVSGPHWKVLPFYLAPLDGAECVEGPQRDSAGCPARPACTARDPDAECRALHFRVPAEWAAPGFDDSRWPQATVYRAEQVTGDPAYVRYAPLFAPAQFIWSRNLFIDNLVLARTVTAAPAR